MPLRILCALALASAAPRALLLAQERIDQILLVEVDALGDARMTIEFNLSAKAWINWKSQYGDHPDLLKRDLTHQFSMNVIEDFALELDNVNRKAIASLRVRSSARHRGAGRYEFLLPGNWKKVTDTGNEWHFSFTELAGQGVMLGQTIRIVLPSNASGMKLEPGRQGQQILRYEIPLPSGSNVVWPTTFFASIGALVVLSALAFLRRR